VQGATDTHVRVKFRQGRPMDLPAMDLLPVAPPPLRVGEFGREMFSGVPLHAGDNSPQSMSSSRPPAGRPRSIEVEMSERGIFSPTGSLSRSAVAANTGQIDSPSSMAQAVPAMVATQGAVGVLGPSPNNSRSDMILFYGPGQESPMVYQQVGSPAATPTSHQSTPPPGSPFAGSMGSMAVQFPPRSTLQLPFSSQSQTSSPSDMHNPSSPTQARARGILDQGPAHSSTQQPFVQDPLTATHLNGGQQSPAPRFGSNRDSGLSSPAGSVPDFGLSFDLQDQSRTRPLRSLASSSGSGGGSPSNTVIAPEFAVDDNAGRSGGRPPTNSSPPPGKSSKDSRRQILV